MLTEEGFFAELRRLSHQPQMAEKAARRLLSLLEGTDFYADWRITAFVIKYPDPSGSGVVFSLPVANKTGWFGFYKSCLRPQIVKVLGTEEAADRVLNSHCDRLKRLGAKLKGKDIVSVEIASLEGKEEEVICLLQETANSLRNEGERVARQAGE